MAQGLFEAGAATQAVAAAAICGSWVTPLFENAVFAPGRAY
jgi:hypothetical protein